MSTLKKVAARMGKIAASPPSTPAPQGTSMSAEIERLRRQNAELAASNAKLQGDHDKAHRALVATQSERDQERMRTTLMRHAASAVDPEDVADALILKGRVKLVDGRLVSAEDPAVDAEAVVKTFLEKKPHLVRGTQSSGSGSPPITGTIPSPPAPAKHDMKTAEGKTAAFREGLLKMVPSPTPTAASGRGPVT